jgi:hypothetical protein
MCVFMSDKTFDAEGCDIGGHASATNGWSDTKTPIENAPCNRPLTQFTNLRMIIRQIYKLMFYAMLSVHMCFDANVKQLHNEY